MKKTRIRWPAILALVATLILLLFSIFWVAEPESIDSFLSWAVAFLFPIGLTLITWSAVPCDRSENVATLSTMALAVAMIGYWTSGFAFQFGGVASVSDIEGLQDLSRFFSLVRGEDSAGWGFVGLQGFLLDGNDATAAALQLFLSQLPLAISVVLIVLSAVPRGTPPLAQLLVGLIVSAITYPIAGHWVSGGGWLAQLGHTLSMGHGLVDFSGVATVFIVSAATVLSAALVFGRKPLWSDGTATALTDDMPTARSPLLAAVGVLLTVVGWIALTLANPLLAEKGDLFNRPLFALNGLAGFAGGALMAQFYSWLTKGRFDPLMGPRGALAGLIAVSAGAPFLPTWAALVTGGVAGLSIPLAIYVVEHLLRFQDITATIAGYGLPGFWGLVSVGLFADGRWGQSWNGGAGPGSQGVSGLFVVSGLQADSGQLAAQVWGAIALFTLGFLLPWGFLKTATGLLSLRFPRRGPVPQADHSNVKASTASSEGQSAARSLDRVVNVDDRG